MSLNMALLLVGILSTAVFYRDLLANPLDAGRGLLRFYQLPVLSALVLIGILGGGQ